METLKFHDIEDDTTIELGCNNYHSIIYIEIKSIENDECWSIGIDKQTAIKLSKELRKQIALLE